MPVASPGARWNVGVPTFIVTRRCVVSRVALAYSMRVWSADGSTNSSKVDVCETTACRVAASRPSAPHASAIVCSVIGRPPTGPNICVRSMTSLTGRFTARAAIAAITTCDHVEPLQPKPPPTNGQTTRTFFGSMPSVRAIVLRSPTTSCVAS